MGDAGALANARPGQGETRKYHHEFGRNSDLVRR
jgi:hypothetical protein